jgi:hypothetical protein
MLMNVVQLAVTVEQLFFDQKVPGSIPALCCFVFNLLINLKFEFLAKKMAPVGVELRTL